MQQSIEIGTLLGEKADYYFGPAIYFLYLNGKIDYVGQAINLARRLAEHAGTFDEARYIKVPKQELDKTEREWIKMIRPSRNKMLNGKRGASARIRFTKAAIERLPIPATGRVYVYDEATPNLTLAVMANGVKSFYLYKRIAGRPERVHIGRFPDITIEQARRKADELKGDIAQGINPAERKRDLRLVNRARRIA